MTVLLPRLLQFYLTDRFTVDIDSGEVFCTHGNGMAYGRPEMPTPPI